MSKSFEIEYDEDGYETVASWERRMSVSTENTWDGSCEHCGTELEVQSVNHRFCSPACRQAARREKGRPPAAQCGSCGASLAGKRADARYCSAACRVRTRRAA